jgi:response regulator RpfG family c-di-GMP phosphodiesterase
MAAGLDENSQETLLNAAPMDDIGKIGRPDYLVETGNVR